MKLFSWNIICNYFYSNVLLIALRIYMYPYGYGRDGMDLEWKGLNSTWVYKCHHLLAWNNLFHFRLYTIWSAEIWEHWIWMLSDQTAKFNIDYSRYSRLLGTNWRPPLSPSVPSVGFELDLKLKRVCASGCVPRIILATIIPDMNCGRHNSTELLHVMRWLS